MRFSSWAKPQYLYRPEQALRRIVHSFSRSSGHECVVLPWHLDLRVDTREDIGRSIWQLGVFDLVLTETLWRLLDPGQVAIDVGANIGYAAGLMAVRVGVRGEVLAFEPHPEVFESLVENSTRARHSPGVGEIQLFKMAVGAAVGVARLCEGEGFGSNHGVARLTEISNVDAIDVEVTTLDAILGEGRADLVKIDVEGAEFSVLEGADRALSEGRIRHVLFECYPSEVSSVVGKLSSLGYKVFGLGRKVSGLVLSPPEKPPRLPAYEAPNYLATRDPDFARARLEKSGWRSLRPGPSEGRG